MNRRDKWWVREIERMNRVHAEERAALIAAVAHLSGKPIRPADPPAPDTPDEPRATVASPEQYPDNFDLGDAA